MANIQGSVILQQISDAEMVKIYQFKEKHAASFTFSLATGSNSQPMVTLSWNKLEGAEAVYGLVRELQPKA